MDKEGLFAAAATTRSIGKKKGLRQKIFQRSVKGVQNAILDGNLNNFLVILGAGISVASGIPDFRSKDGIYNLLKNKGFERPEEVFSPDWFRDHPNEFYKITNQLFPSVVKPTRAHEFLKWLHDRGLLLRIYTQNVDGLEEDVGIPKEKIVQLHGSMKDCLCQWCGQRRPRKDLTNIPMCERCNKITRPNVVFWGETVNMGNTRKKDFSRCGALLVMGTSLTVYPCAALVNKVRLSVPRIIVNDVPVGWPNQKGHLWNVFRFNDHFIRDVMLQGDVQDICHALMKTIPVSLVAVESETEKKPRSYVDETRPVSDVACKEKTTP